MQRPEFNHAGWAGALAVSGLAGHAPAQSMSSLSGNDALAATREALAHGVRAAVSQWGQAGGFLTNPKVRIRLPQVLDRSALMLKATGQGKRPYRLVLAVNDAAEQAMACREARLGLIKPEDADLSGYVTARTLDGLYKMIGEEERTICQNPAQAATALLKKVFGAL